MNNNAEIMLRAYRAIDILQGRAKLSAQEFRERTKLLRRIMHDASAYDSASELGLDGAFSISPEDERLLADPTHGL